MTPETQKSALRESLETLGLDENFESQYKNCKTRAEFDECEKLIKKKYYQESRKNHPDKGRIDGEEKIKKINEAYYHLTKVKEEAITVSGQLSSSAFDRDKFSREIKRLESKDFEGQPLPQRTTRPASTFFDPASNSSSSSSAYFGSAWNSSRPASAHFDSASNSSRPASAHFGQTGFSIFFIPGVGIILFASHLPSQKPSPSRNPECSHMPPHQDKNRSQDMNKESFNGDTSYKDQKPKSFGFSINDEYLHVKNVNYSNNKFPLGSRKFSLSFCDLLISKNNDLGYSRGWGRN
ncbi:MAG: DnaJ domain-containing protein [Rickettsiales bacterium]